MEIKTSFPLEIRQLIGHLLKDGKSTKEIAETLGWKVGKLRGLIYRLGGMSDYDPEHNPKRSMFHYSYEERLIIENGIKEGTTIINIAKVLDRSVASVHHEIERAGGKQKYCAFDAHKRVNPLFQLDPYECLAEKVQNLEMQIEIILDALQELMGVKK